MIKKFAVRPFIVKLYCDNCGEEMEPLNIMLPTYPPQYQYKCPKCARTANTLTNYPELIYEVVKEVK